MGLTEWGPHLFRGRNPPDGAGNSPRNFEPCKCTSKGIRRQGIVLKHMSPLQKSLGPVVTCPRFEYMAFFELMVYYVFVSLSRFVVYGRFPKFHRVFVGPRPWHIEIRHRVKKTSAINLFGFETLKLKIRRLKLWKPTVCSSDIREAMGGAGGAGGPGGPGGPPDMI